MRDGLIAADPGRSLPALEDLESAASIVYGAMPPTPQYAWPILAEATGARVWVKHENHTPVGAFKIRGGLVYLDRLARTRPVVRGIVVATRGNHGQSIAFAAARHGLNVAIVVPHGNSRDKNAAMRALGAEMIEAGDDFQASFEHAARLATERGWHRMPSFDPALVAGVGTYGLEFLRAVPELEAIYVPIGLGSGICGVLAAKEALGRDVEVIGVTSTGAPATKLSLERGRTVSHPVTTAIADGVACRTPNDAALLLMTGRVARVVEATDDDVASAMSLMYRATHNVAEGAGALGLAVLMKAREAMRGRQVGLVLTGGNVDADVFGEVLRRDKSSTHRRTPRPSVANRPTAT
jgi:threonine dehydratase